MYSIAYKWRLTTTKYAYITSTSYRADNSDPDFTLAQITTGGKLDSADEQTIKDKVRDMSADEYRQCFEYMYDLIQADEDGKYINLKNWEYYYHFKTDEKSDDKIFFVEATATATTSNDGEAHASVINDRGALKFTFEIPRGIDGKDGVDGKDGIDGEPINDGIYNESIYKLTKNNEAPRVNLPDDWDVEGSYYQNNGYVIETWTNKPSGITSTHKYEWISTRRFDAAKRMWEAFSTPVLIARWGEDGKDGDGIEYIYKGTEENTTPELIIPEDWENSESPYQTKGYYPSDWSPNPDSINNVGRRYGWVSIRKEVNGVWQRFSEPALWSNWADDGDGIEYVYFLNNTNTAPELDKYDTNTFEYQDSDFIPTTDGKKWNDDYIEPTYENRYSWVTSRKYKDGKWIEFSPVKLWNTYKIGGKTSVDLYARSSVNLTTTDLPVSENGISYYSFNRAAFFNDVELTEGITSFNSYSKKVIWKHDIPSDIDGRYLYKTSARVEVKNNYDEAIEVGDNLWQGPYLLATDGENGANTAPYLMMDDDSLSLPISKKDNTPNNTYTYSFNASLYFSDSLVTINEGVVKIDNNNGNITINDDKTGIIDNGNKYCVSFAINTDKEFSELKFISLTLKGEYEGKEIKATGQFKVIPYYTEDVTLYKILLDKNTIFVPEDYCEKVNDKAWESILNASVVDDKGNNIEVGKLYYEKKDGERVDFTNRDNSEGVNGVLKFISCPDLVGAEGYEDYLLITDENLPNPIKLIHVVDDKIREVEYVDILNIPRDGKDGENGANGEDGKDGASSKLVAVYCITNEETKPSTPSGGSFNFETNETVYPEGWGEYDPTYSGIVWYSQTVFNSDNNDNIVWTKPIRLTGEKGKDGSSNILDLSNDTDQVYTNNDVIIADQVIETTVILTDSEIYPDDIEVYIGDINVTENIEFVKEDGSKGVKIKLLFNSGSTFNENEINYTIKVSSVEYSKIFKVVKLNGNVDYDLEVTPTFIKIDSDGNFSPSALTVNINKSDISVNNRNITKLDKIPEGFELLMYRDNLESSVTMTFLSTVDLNRLNPKPEKFIKFDLISDDNVYDSIIIECVRDGQNGEQGPQGPQGETGPEGPQGEKGETGNDGQNGKLLYPMGEWNPEITYTSSTQTTPFVMFGGEYYVLISEESIKGNAPADEEGKIRPEWVKMEQYEAIYTKLLVAGNGLVGGSVYNGDYVFSKNGKNVNNSITIEGEYYSNFDDAIVDSIFSGGTSLNSFIPNYLVDFNQGRAWFGNGKTIIDKNGVVYTKDIVEMIQDFPIPYPSGSTGWDSIKTGATLTGTSILSSNKVYIKNINSLNSYLFDDDFSQCPSEPIILHYYIPDNLITRPNTFYKGEIYLGNTCASQKYISFPGQIIKYNNTKYEEAKSKTHSIHVIGSTTGNEIGGNKIEFLVKWDGKSTIAIKKAGELFSSTIKKLDIELIGKYEIEEILRFI